MSVVRRCPWVLLGVLCGAAGAADERLRVATWGGDYARVQRQVFFEPFARRFGVSVETRVYDGDLAPLRGAGAGGSSPWDVVSVDQVGAAEGCREGLFAQFETLELAPAPDGTPAGEDFADFARHRCGVASALRSLLFFYDPRAFPAGAPATIRDVFDPRAFPGRRALPMSPRGTLEWALLADGVAAEEVYRVLGTPGGTERALARLDALEGQLTWWRTVDQPLQLLRAADAALVAGFGELVTAALLRDGVRAEPLWDGQLWQVDYWAVVAQSPRAAVARQFVRFATGALRQVEFARHLPTGAVRHSAMALVQPALARLLPNAAQRRAGGMRLDLAWWQTDGQDVRRRFSEWLLSRVAPVDGGDPPFTEQAVGTDSDEAGNADATQAGDVSTDEAGNADFDEAGVGDDAGDADADERAYPQTGEVVEPGPGD